MCDSRAPLNGADSAPVEPTFIVHLRGLYDTDDRTFARVTAADAKAAERIARQQNPGYFTTWVREAS